MTLTECLYVFPTCSSSFPYWAELAFCFLLQHYNKHAGRDESLGNKSHNSRRKFAKDQLQPAAFWTDPIHLEIRASEKERGKENCMYSCIATCSWEGMCLCVLRAREDFYAQRRKLCNGTRGRFASVVLKKSGGNTLLKGIILYLHRRMANSIPLCKSPHFCWVITLDMWACN